MTSATQEQDSVREQLVRLSHEHAVQGDVRRAQLAVWASDLHVLEALLWENGLGDAPDPGAQLAAVGEAVAAALEGVADRPSGEVTARQVVETAREALVTTFDESVHGLLTDLFAPLDHLDAWDPRSAGAAGGSAVQRLDGRTPQHLVAELRAAAADCMAVAHLMADEGQDAAARRLARQADAAAFEAYLIAAAVVSGDDRLATVDLRWDLAADQPAERLALTALVGTAERATLVRTFESLPGA